MVEPFGDADYFRASIAIYEYAVRAQWSESRRGCASRTPRRR